MLKAKYGDCFLISLKNKKNDNTINLLIDCGFNETFEDTLKSELEKLADKKEKISLLIITHLDQDHIQGAISLLEQNGRAETPKIIEIEEIWHNSYRHLFNKDINSKRLSPIEQYRLKSFYKGLSTKLKKPLVENDISAKESVTLGSLILNNNYKWNIANGNKGVYSKLNNENITGTYKELNTLELAKGVQIKLLSPSFEKLEKIKRKFQTELKKVGISCDADHEFIDISFELSQLLSEDGNNSFEKNISSKKVTHLKINDIKSGFENTLFTEDKSPSNGSSIAFVIEFEGKRVLYLSDSHPSIIKENLQYLYPKETNEYPLIFDAIKISHHGSAGNTSPELLSIVDSPIYLISTDGSHPKHSHPDVEVLAQIVRRPIPKPIKKRQLIFNYKTNTSKLFDTSELQEYFNFEVLIKQSISL